MGVVAGDIDGDGDEDLFMTHLTADCETPAQLARRATDVAKALAAGESRFEQAARVHSLAAGARDGGVLGWVDAQGLFSLGADVAKAVRQLEIGAVSELFRTESGFVIYRVRARRQARPMTFGEAAAQMRQQLVAQRRGELEAQVRRRHLAALELKLTQPNQGPGKK